MRFRIDENLIDYEMIPYSQRRFISVGRNGIFREERISRLYDALKILGSKCTKCPCTDVDCLVIDHINGDGCMERNIKGFNNRTLYICIYYAFVYDITEAIEIIKSRYQILCACCNMKKQRRNREYGDIHHQFDNIDARAIVLKLKSLVYTVGEIKNWRTYDSIL